MSFASIGRIKPTYDKYLLKMNPICTFSLTVQISEYLLITTIMIHNKNKHISICLPVVVVCKDRLLLL